MAVVSRITTLQITSIAGGTRTFTATATVQDTAAGSSVSVTLAQASAGLTPPETPNQDIELSFRIDNGATIVRTVTMSGGTTSQNFTFHFTANGQSGGGNRAGTIRMRIRVNKTNGGPTATYTANSDGSGEDSLPTGWSVSQRDQGWIRGTTTRTEAISNVGLGGAKSEPAQYDESLFVRLTEGAVSYSARALTVAVSDTSPALSGNTNSTTAAQRDRTFSSVVDDRFPNAETAGVSLTVTVPNATLTGLPDWTITSDTPDTIDVDPRLWVTHLLQLNSTYAEPPLSDPNIVDEVVFPVIGYIGTNLRPARGTLVGEDITGGINGVSFDFSFVAEATAQDFPGTGFTTANRGGEDGWQDDLYIWSSATAGEWTKTVTTDLSDLDDAYLVGAEASYFLIAVDPNLAVMVIAGTDSPDSHIHEGVEATVEIDVMLIDKDENVLVEPEEATVLVRRIDSNNRAQHLNASEEWEDSFDGTVPPVPVAASRFTAAQLSTDQFVYRVTFTTDATWTNDFEAIGHCVLNGVRYDNRDQREIVGTANRHDGPAFDPTGLFK